MHQEEEQKSSLSDLESETTATTQPLRTKNWIERAKNTATLVILAWVIALLLWLAFGPINKTFAILFVLTMAFATYGSTAYLLAALYHYLWVKRDNVGICFSCILLAGFIGMDASVTITVVNIFAENSTLTKF